LTFGPRGGPSLRTACLMNLPLPAVWKLRSSRRINRRIIRLLPVLLALALSGTCHGDVTLPSIISDNMVIQQREKLNLWGQGRPRRERHGGTRAGIRANNRWEGRKLVGQTRAR